MKQCHVSIFSSMFLNKGSDWFTISIMRLSDYRNMMDQKHSSNMTNDLRYPQGIWLWVLFNDNNWPMFCHRPIFIDSWLATLSSSRKKAPFSLPKNIAFLYTMNKTKENHGLNIGCSEGFVSLLLYFEAISKVISGFVQTCNSVHSWQHYSIVPVGNQAISTRTWYPAQS